MPIKYIDRFIESAALSDDLELEAKAGEGFVIKEIYAESSTEEEYITMIISDTVMFSSLVEVAEIGMLRFPDAKENYLGLFAKIREKYPEVPLFRVSEGEKLIITANEGTIKCLVRYAHLTGADIPKSSEPGGTLSDNRLFLSSGSKSGTTSGTVSEYVVDLVSINPKGLIDFPFLEKVPSGYRMELLGFCIGKDATSTTITIEGLRLWFKDESILKPEQAYLGADLFKYISESGQLKPFLFDSPISMVAGDKLEAEVQIIDTANPTDYTIYMTFIFNQIKV